MYTTSLSEAVAYKELLVLAVPSQAMRTVVVELVTCLPEFLPLFVNTSKGVEEDTLLTMSGVLEAVLGSVFGPVVKKKLAVLSGPSFAAEVARGLPTAVTVAATVPSVAHSIQHIFSGAQFRVYTTTDVIGVVSGGALKNVIALAAGVSDGLGCGYSARAALITRGLAEMTRLTECMGGLSQTLSGLSGMGDLVLTCTSSLSRNYSVGTRLGKGEHIKDILHSMTMVAEGVRTCRSIYFLAQRFGVEMPIVEQVYALLYDAKSPRHVVADLLAREVKPEFTD
jgi:glycerol-3-phosphate dehydrogenase (NAD(P)+)